MAQTVAGGYSGDMPDLLPVLNFQTSEALHWGIRGEMLRKLFGAHLTSLGYEVDYKSDPDECDWYFRAKLDDNLFGVVLVLSIEPGQHWWLDLERLLPTKTQMPDCELRSKVMSQLEECLRDCDYVSDIELRPRAVNPPATRPWHANWEVAWSLIVVAIGSSLLIWFSAIRGYFD